MCCRGAVIQQLLLPQSLDVLNYCGQIWHLAGLKLAKNLCKHNNTYVSDIHFARGMSARTDTHVLDILLNVAMIKEA